MDQRVELKVFAVLAVLAAVAAVLAKAAVLLVRNEFYDRMLTIDCQKMG